MNDRDDHRKQHVVLTKAGAEKLRDLTVLHRDELKRFRSHLSDLLDVLA
mgnify:FL=1